MKLSRIVVPCMAVLLAAAPSLRADTVFVQVWNVPVIAGGNVPAPGSSFYTTNPVTYSNTLSNSSGSVFNMASGSAPTPANYTIGTFLTSGGDVLGSTPTGIDTANLNDPVNCFMNCTTSTIFKFAGLYNGGANPTNVTILSDDGVILFDVTTGTTLCSNAAPQSEAPTSCTIPGGPQILNLYYGEVEGPPADLSALSLSLQSIPVTPTVPEPSSIALLGTGLLAAAGVLRRRLFS